jgi:hypothetical protein
MIDAEPVDEPSARERLFRLQGRIQALTDVTEAFTEFAEPGDDQWGDFLAWLSDAKEEVITELKLLRAEVSSGD